MISILCEKNGDSYFTQIHAALLSTPKILGKVVEWEYCSCVSLGILDWNTNPGTVCYLETAFIFF